LKNRLYTIRIDAYHPGEGVLKGRRYERGDHAGAVTIKCRPSITTLDQAKQEARLFYRHEFSPQGNIHGMFKEMVIWRNEDPEDHPKNRVEEFRYQNFKILEKKRGRKKWTEMVFSP
jgi:hypothetical protein